MSPASAGAARATSRATLRPSARAAVLAALVAAILLASVVPLQQFLEQRGRIARLEHEAAQLEQANRDVAARIDRLKDPTVLERLARECLGMVRPDEIRFVPVPEGGAPATPDC